MPQRDYQVTVTLLEPRDQPDREPDYVLDWHPHRSGSGEVMVVWADVDAKSPLDAVAQAIDDLARAFGDGPMGREVTLSVQEGSG